MIPAGRYLAKPEWNGIQETAKKGTPYASIVFTICDGEHTGQQLYWDGWLSSDVSRTITFKAMQIAGWDGSGELSDGNGIGRVCQIVVKHETYEGKTRARIQYVNDPNALPIKKEVNASALDEINEAARAFLIESGADNIPF